MKKILFAIWTYLKDWKNWLTHSIIGIGLLLIAIYLPVKPVYRIAILLVVVSFNIIRMRREKIKKQEKEKQS